MKAGKASRTAEIAAAVRAHHYLFVSPTIFEDPFALEFTDPISRRIIMSRPLRWMIFEVLLRPLHSVGGQIVARSRYAEDRLMEAIDAGVEQYVIIGAGFDSFAFRRMDLSQKLRVFELDHPDTQKVKWRRMLNFSDTPPENVDFLEIDFERETVADRLLRSTFQPDKPAFFSWLGTTVYLSNAATIGTLSSIAGISATGSEIVFDYGVPATFLKDTDRRTARKLGRFTARRGEPLIGSFHPGELENTLETVGLELTENISALEQKKRYFADRKDTLRPFAASFFARARVI